jgi:hypothetical protein
MKEEDQDQNLFKVFGISITENYIPQVVNHQDRKKKEEAKCPSARETSQSTRRRTSIMCEEYFGEQPIGLHQKLDQRLYAKGSKAEPDEKDF